MHGCRLHRNSSWKLATVVCLCLLLCGGVVLSHAGGVDDADAFESPAEERWEAPSHGDDQRDGRVATDERAATGSAPYLRDGRYTWAHGAARADQRQPLDATMRIAFGDSISTIGQAVVELLARSGYRLGHRDQENCLLVQQLLFRQPLPASLRDLGPVPLLSGLNALIGIAWGVHVNELGRTLQLRIRPEYRDEQWLERFLEQYRSTAPVEREILFAPFSLAEFRTLGDTAHRAIQQASAAARTRDLRLVVRGHSHSHAGWATVEQARKRAQTVAEALEQRGVRRGHIVVETSVSNHREPTAVLRHGVDIELRGTQSPDRTANCQQLRSAVADSADNLPKTGHFTVRQGSLKANIERLLESFSLRVGQWLLADGDYEYDWDIPYEYQVPAADAEQALSNLLESYDIQPTLNMRDRTVDFTPRYAPRRSGEPK